MLKYIQSFDKKWQVVKSQGQGKTHYFEGGFAIKLKGRLKATTAGKQTTRLCDNKVLTFRANIYVWKIRIKIDSFGQNMKDFECQDPKTSVFARKQEVIAGCLWKGCDDNS